MYAFWAANLEHTIVSSALPFWRCLASCNTYQASEATNA